MQKNIRKSVPTVYVDIGKYFELSVFSISSVGYTYFHSASDIHTGSLYHLKYWSLGYHYN